MRARCAWLVVVMGMVGCAKPHWLAPRIHNRRWVEVTTPHIHMRTDLSASAARKRVKDLEQIHATLVDSFSVVVPGGRIPAWPVEVIFLARCDEMKLLHGNQDIAAFVITDGGDFRGEPLLVSCEHKNKAFRREAMIHELVHVFNASVFGPLPVWLEEGLASYFQTLTFEKDEIVIGKVPRSAYAVWSLGFHIPTLSELRASNPREFYVAHAKEAIAAYTAGWKLVHFFSEPESRYRAQFTDLLTRLARRESIELAWTHAFAGVDEEAMADEFEHYRVGTIVPVWRGKYRPPEVGEPQLRVLRDGEAHVAWLQLQLAGAMYAEERAPLLDQQLAAAERADRGWAGLDLWRAAIAFRFKKDRPDFAWGAQVLRRAAAADVHDPRPRLGLLLLWMDEIALGERELDPTHPDADLDRVAAELLAMVRGANELALLARYHVLRGRSAQALPLAQAALQRDGRCGACLDTMALIAFRLGRAKEAAELEERALYAISDRPQFRLQAEGAYRRWSAYKRAAGLPAD